MKYLLDSVILIDHFNGIKAAEDWIKQHQKIAAISPITRLEVLSGATSAQHAQVMTTLLDFFPCLDFVISLADFAAELRREYRWKTPDALQAAFAKHYKLKLVTRNTKDFSTQKHRFVEIPYSL